MKENIYKINLYQKIKIILNESQKRTLIYIAFLLIIGVLVEIFGLGLMMPTLSILAQTKLQPSNSILFKANVLLGNPGQNNLVIFFMTFLIFFYVFKVLFLTYSNWKQSKFSSNLTAALSKELFLGYMYAPYSFHLRKNSSELIRNIQSETSIFTSLSQQFIYLLTEIAVIIGVCIMLFIIEPFGTIVIFIIITIAVLLFHLLTKKKIKKWGVKRQEHVTGSYKKLIQGLGGVKDIKILGREEYFTEQFDLHNVENAKILTKLGTIEQIPRLYLELLSIIGLAGITISIILQNKPLSDLISTMGLFVAAAFRMLPSVNKIMAAMQRLSFSKPAINTIYNELCEIRGLNKNVENKKIDFHFKNSITIEQINFSYPESSIKVLDNITFKITKSSCIGIIGKSGSGKSTLIDIMLGLLDPDSGNIKIDGINIVQHTKDWQSIIGYVPQSIYLLDDTLRNNIAFGLNESEIDDVAIYNSIIAAQLTDFINELPEGLETYVGERGVRLSGGQRQRIGIARAIYRNPEILFFDEATSALDTNTETGVMESINKLKGKKTIIIVAHRLSTLSNCDVIYKIENGKIVNSGSSIDMLK